MALFGLPFFLAGVFMARNAVRVLFLRAVPAQDWTPISLAFMSLLFLCVGSALVFGRRWLTVDLSRDAREGLRYQ